MKRKIGSMGAVLRRPWRYAALAAVVPALLLTGGQASAREGVRLLRTLTLPGSQQIQSFDIGWVDTNLGVYILADRQNATLQVYDTSSDQLINQVASKSHPFSGASPKGNNFSGPDGVLTVPCCVPGDLAQEIWAGDGDSTIKVFDAFSGALKTVINTGGKLRADELCYDSINKTVMMANDADAPPFVTIIDAAIGSLTQYKILATIPMDGKVGPFATNGIEQCQSVGGFFYVNIPEVNGPGNDTKPGAVVVVDGKTNKIVAIASVNIAQCAGPQGMAVGPKDAKIAGATDILLGCNVGSSVQVLAVNGAGVALAGAVNFVAGADQVAYNAADNSYYLADGGVPGVGVAYSQYQLLSSVDADTLKPDIAVKTGISGKSGNHSVAADPTNNQVFVPIAAGSGGTHCPTANGCIAVFQSQAP